MMLDLAGNCAVCHMNVRILLVLLCFLFAACGAIDSLPRQLLASGKIKGRSPKKATKLDACAGKSIYILDLSVFAEENNVPACNLSEVRILHANTHIQLAYVSVFVP